MYNGQSVSLDTILWKVTRSGIYEQLNPEDAAMYAKEAIRDLGAPLVYQNKITTPPLEIIDHKANLPKDLVLIRGVRLITDEANFENNPIPLRYATDVYHESVDCDPQDEIHPLVYPREYTYTVSGGVITTKMSEGKIQISYKALQTCEDGYPLIPDDEDVLRAIEFHIRWRFLEGLWEMGKVPDKVFNYVAQNRDWYIGAAQSKMALAGIDHVESAMNAVNRLLIPSLSFQSGFKRLGEKERFKRFY